MTRRTHPGRRTLTLLLRNARGHFIRVLPTIEETLAAKRPRAPRRPRPVIVHIQLALF